MFLGHITGSFHIFKVIEDSTHFHAGPLMHFKLPQILLHALLMHFLELLDENSVFEFGCDIEKSGGGGELATVEVECAEELEGVIEEGSEEEVVEERLVLLLKRS